MTPLDLFEGFNEKVKEKYTMNHMAHKISTKLKLKFN